MKAIRAYFKGWQYAFRKIKMWGLLYGLNALLAFLCTLPLLKLLNEKLGQSAVLQEILPDFDYAVYNDVVHQFGEAISVVLDQSWVMIALFFLLSIFTMGGILRTFQKVEKPFSFRMFWAAGAYYFWRVFRLTIYFLIVHFILLGAAIGLFLTFMEGGPGTFENEYVIIRAAAFIFPVYLLLAMIVLMIQDYAKIHLVEKDPGFLFSTIWQATGLVFRKMGSVFSLYLLNFITFGIVAFAYWLFNKNGKISDAPTVLGAFVVGQLFVFFRIGSKLMNLGSASWLYQQVMNPPPETSEPVIETAPRLIADRERPKGSDLIS